MTQFNFVNTYAYSMNNTIKTNYVMDASFNFYDEINMTNDTDTNHTNDINQETDENSENICLISNMPLDNTSVTLPCNHSFNYYYIFNEILNSKKKHSSYYNGVKLNYDQIRCPYCRTVYNHLLPMCLDINGAYKCNDINSAYLSFKIKCKEPDCCNQSEENIIDNIIDNIKNTIVYVTPIGYYCRKHYNNIKRKNKINHEKEMKQNDTNDINIVNEQNHDNWKSSEWSQYTVDKLKFLLREHKLKVSGSKGILINRLIEHNITPHTTSIVI